MQCNLCQTNAKEKKEWMEGRNKEEKPGQFFVSCSSSALNKFPGRH